jgi:transcriptional regulator EpsA
MAFVPSLSPEEIHHFHGVVTHAVAVRSHFDMLVWLQGDIQRYLPHDIMIAAWGNFNNCETVRHDIISPLTGVRSHHHNPETITPLLLQLFSRWTEFGNVPFAINAGTDGFQLVGTGLECALHDALKRMRCAIVHGINDERGSHDCLYVAFSTKESYSETERVSMSMVLPYMDSALRQVPHLPHQSHERRSTPFLPAAPLIEAHDLSGRESEVLCWVALGKTNPEIGSILTISEFTVKNHMQSVFKKLDVSNRAQAVGKFKALMNYV